MTDNSVDQITKEPETITPQKDPKKVAAGKKLAEYHKKAKMALEAEKNNSTEEETTAGKSWVPEISPGTVIALVGISLTAFDLYMRLTSKHPQQ